mmetsp:Transcript_22574/g.49100  ORF Transcript_22574/g.49100 Transcript_22574/m.49100 type:complete len:359 (+) Transcript_22574:127-1203(+)|eukprot:CAMPEP_0168186570 /NCGR_PEP_ID=MMETSP0139_2-20121125/14515_1 /TAXON_ID=44445 /ORGANISM="Pseudo-nitzschia australis, Strain 10249 10 AB" /LENGTH=358 /DNA_ID=CAMNT_0008108611 /DNA_START=48 /DNA_END=1124 /DNA_ORIENTATION=+
MTIPEPVNSSSSTDRNESASSTINNSNYGNNVDIDDINNDETNNDNNSSNSNIDEESPEHAAKIAAVLKKALVGAILLGLIVFVIIDASTNQHVKTAIFSFLEWIEEHPALGVLGFVAVYFVATVCFVPGSILTLGAGFVFSSAFRSLWIGVLLGTGAVFVGASLGAIAAFLLGRYLFRDAVSNRFLNTNDASNNKYKRFEALDNALRNNGLKIMVLLRLSPIIPFNALNYLAGVTGVKFRDYALACLGMLPATIVYVFLGASAGSLAEIGGKASDIDGTSTDSTGGNRTVTIVVAVVGVAFGVLAVGLTSYYAKQELNKVIEAEKQQQRQNDDNGNNDGDEREGTADGAITSETYDV